MLLVTHPPTCLAERKYIYDLLFQEFLGIEYRTEMQIRRDVRITLEGDSYGRELIVADQFFQQPEENWLRMSSMPQQPVETWNTLSSPLDVPLVNPEMPVIFGRRLGNGCFVDKSETRVSLGIDLFGSAFFMLTRYEEAVKPDRDRRDRFPALASLAYQEGFLDRPIVNEYLEVLWWGLKVLWSGLERRERNYRLYLSHDVDWPLGITNRTLAQVFRNVAGDLMIRKSLKLAMRRLQSFVQVKRGNLDADLHNTFDFIMNLSEQHGLQSSFYFITDHSAGQTDGNYSIKHMWIKRLLRRIHERGHNIGLHPSYHSFRDSQRIKREFEILLQTAEAEGIHQKEWGGRQHYLRWECPTTWQAWEDAGLNYDSTLSFADHAGFRCGVCYEYRVFNLNTRQALHLRERPLIVMEGSLLGPQYMDLTYEQAWREIAKLRDRCRMYKGDFTLLWHNNQLINQIDMDFYQRVVQEAVKGGYQ